MIYLGGWSRAKERRIQIYSPSLPPSPPRATSFTPPPPLAASLLLALGFIDPLYIYLLCRGPLCHGSKGSRTGCTCRPLPHPLLTTPAIFGQYYKNQPTDFLRKILPPCSPEYFIAVHPSPPSSSPPPPFPRGKGEEGKKRRKEIGRGSGTRFGFASSRAPPPPRLPSFRDFERREKEGRSRGTSLRSKDYEIFLCIIEWGSEVQLRRLFLRFDHGIDGISVRSTRENRRRQDSFRSAT